ncbi:MAG: murein L,D-transpeptidase [Pedosphaera sp.]|nr:murein L,D-transpeptidase [Pedosphaera sp.]
MKNKFFSKPIIVSKKPPETNQPPARTNQFVPPVVTNTVTNITVARPPDPMADYRDFKPHYPKDESELQIELARRGFSPGSIDGVDGEQTRVALKAFQRSTGLAETGQLDRLTRGQMMIQTPPLTLYEITTNDTARLLPMGTGWLEKSKQKRLDYVSLHELVAEKFHCSPKFISRLNPDIDWEKAVAAAKIVVPNITAPTNSRVTKAGSIRINLTRKTLQVFDTQTNLMAHFPCSIAKRVEKRPVGDLAITVVARNPNYTFDPDNFPESPEARQKTGKLILNPGPNNPVGSVWIGLNLPGYGIHGTPEPEKIGRTESLGCFRLANWNAEHLYNLVTVGTPVTVDP